MLVMVLVFGMTVVGCTGKGGSGSGIGIGGGRTFTDVEKVEDWLANQKGGASPDDPIPFSVRLNLQNMASPESNWSKLLTSINTAGLYVALDLSGCTMPGTEFDAYGDGISVSALLLGGSAFLGKKFIVSLVLPDSTESVAGFLCGEFENLKTAKARNIEYIVGGPGPAGGIVFYDKGDSSGGWRYLEAAPAETEFEAEWGAYKENVTGTETGIGTGKRNTELIAAFLNSRGETGRAAQVCANLSVNGFSGWFLPSTDELNLMYQNLRRNNIGDFTNDWYWSSSQDANHGSDAWDQYFGYGNRDYNYKYGGSSVRAVRAF
jgi:hypothetical protein